MKNSRRIATIAATVVSTVSLAAPAIAAPIVVGPGDPIRTALPGSPVVEGRHMESAMCSTSVPGTITDKDGNKHRVMLTAGHCLNSKDVEGAIPAVGDDVYVPTHENGDVKIGQRGPHQFNFETEGEEADIATVLDSTFNGSDWAFIELEDDVEMTNVSYSEDEYGVNHGEGVEMTGIVDYESLEPGEVSIDNLGEPVCIDGTRTGRSCGYQIFRVRNGVWAIGPRMDHGDSGGNAYNPETRQVIGMNSMVVGPLNRFQPADTAIEEAYGIEDGKVNEHFEVANSNADRTHDYRTISEDSAAIQEYQLQKMREEMELTDFLPESPALPFLPESPQLPNLDELGSQLAAPTVNDVLNQARIAVPGM